MYLMKQAFGCSYGTLLKVNGFAVLPETEQELTSASA